jgi:hypothetical protein
LLTPTANVGRSTATAAQSPFLETVLQLSFGGLRETHSSFFGLDGTDYSVSLSGVQRVSPSLDWVQEFRVVDGPYAGDNGRNLGSVVNTITKSGTNDLHGSLYEYFRNNELDAENPLSAPGLNTQRVNQFGGNIGGPIRRDKTFYFTGYEGHRRAASPTFSTFILGCLDNPGCMGPGTPSINQVKEQFGLQPEQLNSILQIDNYDKAFGKITQVFNERNILNVGYLFNDDRKVNAPTAAPGQGLPSTYRDNLVRDQTIISLRKGRDLSRRSMCRTRWLAVDSPAAFRITRSRASKLRKTSPMFAVRIHSNSEADSSRSGSLPTQLSSVPARPSSLHRAFSGQVSLPGPRSAPALLYSFFSFSHAPISASRFRPVPCPLPTHSMLAPLLQRSSMRQA